MIERTSFEELLTLEIDFDDFKSLSSLSFRLPRRWNGWHLFASDLCYFHYYDHVSNGAVDENTIYRNAFNYFNLIRSHNGSVNICGVFLERETVEIWRHKAAHISYDLVYSPIVTRWFKSVSYWFHETGFSYAPSIIDSESYATRGEAENAAIAQLNNRLAGDLKAAKILAEFSVRTFQASLF